MKLLTGAIIIKENTLAMKYLRSVFICIFTIFLLSTDALAWSSKGHMFIAQEAGMTNPETACFPDLSRNEEYDLLVRYHWHDAAPNTIVTPDYIDRYQISKGAYVKVGSPPGSSPIKIRVPDPTGVLYWEIVELYKKLKGSRGWEYDYYLSNIAHYVGDLSQPLHNFPYDGSPASDGKIYPEVGKWSKEHHAKFDDALDSGLPLRTEKKAAFEKMVIPIKIESADDMKKEISKVANSSISLANKCYSQRRIITGEEALKQVALSVSLLRAIIDSTKQ